MVGLLLILLGKATIIAVNVWFTLLMCRSYEGVRSPVIFCILVGIIAYIISSLFLTLFEFSGLTILHCFILDADVGGDGSKTPESLKSYIKMQEERNEKKDGDETEMVSPVPKNKVSQANDGKATSME